MKLAFSHLPMLAALLLGVAGCTDSPADSGSDLGRAPVVGDIAPDFTQADTAGREISLRQFRGKVVLIDFWASWCVPCRAALPQFRQLWETYRDRDFALLSVSLDVNHEAWTSFIAAENLDWYHTSDVKGWNNAVARLYRVTAIPRAILIDKSGKVIAVDRFTTAQLEAALGE